MAHSEEHQQHLIARGWTDGGRDLIQERWAFRRREHPFGYPLAHNMSANEPSGLMESAVSFRTWRQFLEATPPGVAVIVKDIVQRVSSGGGPGRLYSPPTTHEVLGPPDIQLHCRSGTCGEDRTFSFVCTSGEVYLDNPEKFVFIDYQCRNCNETRKVFSLLLKHDKGTNHVSAQKFGEMPRFGPPLPARVLRLVQSDAQLLKRGFCAENDGYGVGAFAYYRRVLENQTGHLFAELRKAADRLGDAGGVQLLDRASKMTQFSQAVELVKDGLPRRLWIENHNPLTLLHEAISNDLHAGTDEQCLALAVSIRTLLIEMGDRIAEITADKVQVQAAISTLLKKPKRGAKSTPTE